MDFFPVVLVAHLLISLSLVGVILLQRSEGGALGMGGSGAGVMTSRAAGNLLTRITAILATAFFITSLALALMANNRSAMKAEESILSKIPTEAGQTVDQDLKTLLDGQAPVTPAAPLATPLAAPPAAAPAEPQAPMAR